jgi:1-acyl-sn-glycerol-3-phosphate acyltransferase
MHSLASDLYRFLTTLLGWLLMVVGSILLGVLAIPATLLLSPLWPRVREIFSDVTRHALRLYVRSLMFLRIRVEGGERRIQGPRILVANHQSWLDPIVLIGLEPRLGGPVRRYLLRVPILGTIIRLSGFFETDISEISLLEQLRQSVELARARGGGLLFFPEGTRSRTGDVGPFQRGAFRAAVEHELPIQPIVIEGLDRALPPGRIIAQTCRQLVRIRYLDPIEPPFGSGLRRDVVRALTQRVRDQIVEELGRMRAERIAWEADGRGSEARLGEASEKLARNRY